MSHLFKLICFTATFSSCCLHFLFNDTPPTAISTLSLHDALPIYRFGVSDIPVSAVGFLGIAVALLGRNTAVDRKSTRLNSSHRCISYAVFCLKKKTAQNNTLRSQVILHPPLLISLYIHSEQIPSI